MQNLFNREKITLFVGSLVLVMGAASPWYCLPSQALETFGTNLYFINFARVLTAMFAILGLAGTFLFSISRVPRLPFWIGLIAVLLFPYFITTWSPTITFLASSYYQQGENVSSHIDKNFSYVQAEWKQNISLDKPASPPTIFEMSIKDSRFFQISSWQKVMLNGFGYKDSFFGFIGKGWFFCLIGLIISLIGIDLEVGKQNLPALIQESKIVISVAILSFIFILILIINFNILNYKIDTYFAQGEYSQVVNNSKALAFWYPPLQGDELFLERLARAEFYTGKAEPALIYFVKGLERYKFNDFPKAENYFQKSLDLQPNRFLVRGYLTSSILNQGVKYFNDPKVRKPGEAIDLFKKALQIFPNHVETLYSLMLARVVNGEFQESADVAKQIIDGQQYFQQPILGLLGQAYLHLTWSEYSNGDVNKAWKRYRQSIDSRTWKESDSEKK